MSLEANVDNCKERVAYSAAQARHGERMRLWVNGIPLLGAPVAVGPGLVASAAGQRGCSVADARMVAGYLPHRNRVSGDRWASAGCRAGADASASELGEGA